MSTAIITAIIFDIDAIWVMRRAGCIAIPRDPAALLAGYAANPPGAMSPAL